MSEQTPILNFYKAIVVLAGVFVLSSCTSIHTFQPQVDDLAVSGRYDEALNILNNPSQYGRNNQLLFLLDRGMVLHLAGRYKESIAVFEQAKSKFDQFYTQSITKNTASWLWNDYARPYRGEDFERVMINIIQALNYAALGDIKEALVEARDVDSILNSINAQYPAGKKNVYREDAFARFLMGVLYETSGSNANRNDALVSYRKALAAYTNDYKQHYATAVPQVLKQNLLAVSEASGDADFQKYRREFADVTYVPLKKKQTYGEVYLIQYQGQAPRKIPVEIPVPTPDGYWSKISFPEFQRRGYYSPPIEFKARIPNGQFTDVNPTEVGDDIEAIAVKNLENRKARIMSKAVIRPAGKYFAEKALEREVRQEHGRGAGLAIQVAGSLYNMFSEQVDLRSWQTLPAKIRVARLIVEPGQYELFAGAYSLGRVTLKAGQKKFLIVRTIR